MLESTAYLGVARSVTGRRWVGPGEAVERMGAAIAQRAGVADVIGRVLAARGVAPDDALAYLAPSLKALLPDPSTLRDMDAAADRLARAARDGQRVAVFGDYDVDGACAAAMLARWLRGFGVGATLYIPDRIDEGYGPNDAAMTALGTTHDLVVCVDCGSLSHGPVAAARAAGADVLIADHHLCGETLPDACATVNPNRQDETAGLGHLCAAGVAFLLIVAANRLLRRGGLTPPDPLALLDMVALATVADVAPLTGLNRAFVRQGLKVLASRRNPGLRALADAARLSGPPGSFHLGYVLGPRINAGGRVGAAWLGARLLSTDDAAEAGAIADRLEGLNAERRAIEAEVLGLARAQAEARGVDGPLVWAAGEGWHPGVVGIVASRLKERFNRPAVVIGLDGAEGKGSARSVQGVDLGSSVARLAREGLLVKGGGHRMAAGLTVATDRLEAAMARLGALLAAQGAGRGGAQDLRLDGALGPGAATVALAEMLEQAGPWGASAPAPRFAAPAVRVASARIVGAGHVALRLTDGAASMDAIAFGALEAPRPGSAHPGSAHLGSVHLGSVHLGETSLGDFLLAAAGERAHLAGRLMLDDFRGRRRVKLQLDDAAPAF